MDRRSAEVAIMFGTEYLVYLSCVEGNGDIIACMDGGISVVGYVDVYCSAVFDSEDVEIGVGICNLVIVDRIVLHDVIGA